MIWKISKSDMNDFVILNAVSFDEAIAKARKIDSSYNTGQPVTDDISNLLQELEIFKEMLQSDKELCLKGYQVSPVKLLTYLITDLNEIIKKYEECSQ